ncbi:MAG: right-handed parallel beta-helix repeat-containing protein, partial [Myxococcales bacterium]|nr:right-handed parallel beta-helix repeat-containing protein [Myxococcales bacterium]
TGAVTKSVAVSEPPSPSVGPGAHLPIQYEIGSLTGTIWYVATNGNDSNAGTLASPYKTLAKAIGKVGSGQSATVVVRGGEYTDGSVSIPSGRKVHLVAYPGETPIFRGSAKFNSGWTTEGGLAWHAYTAKPVTDGSGISFTTGQNQTGSQMGKHPDQVWKGNSQLQQVGSKGEVSAGKFWVDAGNSRLYLASSDASSNSIEASDKVEFLSVSGSNSVIEGLRITRYSNSANNYGVVRTNVGADHVVFRDVEVIDPAFISIMAAGSAGDITDGVVFEHVTIDGPNWMGLNATWVDNLVVDSVRFVGANRFGEFTTSPQSGAIKTSRCRYIKVFDSEFTGNRSHGIWFDQSNVDVDVAGNVIDDNDGSALFFEISDDLLLINNFIRSSGGNRAVKLAGSSGLKLVNNTIIGGADPIGIYTDNRSKPGCADPNQALCSGSYSSDRRTAATRPATLDWMPRLDLMLNNIIVYPTATGYCGASTPFCVTSTNSTASAPIQTIIHGAEPGRGIPQTRMDGNVYANGAGSIVRVASGNYSSVSAWTTAAAGSPISIGGLDANSKAGNNLVSADGSATNALNHADAIALPTDADINQYLPAGTKHFGILP